MWVFRSDYMSENAEAVLQAMIDAGKPVRPGEVAKAMGIESKEVSKAIKVLKKEGKIHSPKRCYYAPTE
jgi:Mn-dependent DtxR family transcriptional regulator